MAAKRKKKKKKKAAPARKTIKKTARRAPKKSAKPAKRESGGGGADSKRLNKALEEAVRAILDVAAEIQRQQEQGSSLHNIGRALALWGTRGS